LSEHVPAGARHDQPRTYRGASDALADAQVTPAASNRRTRARAELGCERSHYLPAFPALRRTTSPSYRTPLPLYGSGLRSLRMFAATSPTCCLSMPDTVNRVGASTVKATPSGGVT